MIPSDYKPGQRVRYGFCVGVTGWQPPSEVPQCWVEWERSLHQPMEMHRAGFYPLQWLTVLEETKENETI